MSSVNKVPEKDLSQELQNEENNSKRGRPIKKRDFKQFKEDVTVEDSEKEEKDPKKLEAQPIAGSKDEKEISHAKDEAKDGNEQDKEIVEEEEETSASAIVATASTTQKNDPDFQIAPPAKKRRTYKKTGLYSKKNKEKAADGDAITKPKRGRKPKKDKAAANQSTGQGERTSLEGTANEDGNGNEEDEFSDDEVGDFSKDEQQFLHHMKPHAVSLSKQLFQISKTFINQLFFTTFQTRMVGMLNHFYEDKKGKMKAFNHLMQRTATNWNSYRNRVLKSSSAASASASSSTTENERAYWSPKGIHYLMASKELVDFFYPDAEEQKQFYIERYQLMQKADNEKEETKAEKEISTSETTSAKKE